MGPLFMAIDPFFKTHGCIVGRPLDACDIWSHFSRSRVSRCVLTAWPLRRLRRDNTFGEHFTVFGGSDLGNGAVASLSWDGLPWILFFFCFVVRRRVFSRCDTACRLNS